MKKKGTGRNPVVVFLICVVLLIGVCGIGVSVYTWLYNIGFEAGYIPIQSSILKP